MSKDKESSYYDAGGIEVLDIIKAKLTSEQYEGYLLGNSIKYQLRFNFKTVGVGRIRDAVKSNNYITWFVEFLKELEMNKVKSAPVQNRSEMLDKSDAMRQARGVK